MLALLTLSLPARSAESDIVFVSIDSASERRYEQLYGPFPFPRHVLADDVAQIRVAGAKAVVLKFFFDLPSNEVDDEALRQAVGNLPVLLQAALTATTPLGARELALPKMAIAGAPPSNAIDGQEGDFPIAPFAAAAAAVGFVDVFKRDLDRIALIGNYRGAAVKSLVLEILEAEFGTTAMRNGPTVTLGSAVFTLDTAGSLRCPLGAVRPLPVVPEQRLFDGGITPDELRDKIVILGYTGRQSPTFAVDDEFKEPIHLIFAEQATCVEKLIRSGAAQ